MENIRIKVISKEVPGFIDTYASGCYIGVTPRGDIRLTFFEDFHTLPNEIEVEIIDGRGSEQPVVNAPISRAIKCAVTYKTDEISSLISLLSTKLDELHKLKETKQA